MQLLKYSDLFVEDRMMVKVHKALNGSCSKQSLMPLKMFLIIHCVIPCKDLETVISLLPFVK